MDETNTGPINRAEYIEVERNVRLHITDAGVGRPIVLLHGWPLSDEMYEYQYHALINNNFRVLGITLRGFGKSDKPYGVYDYAVLARDIKTVLSILEINDAVMVGFSMGGSIAIQYIKKYKGAHVAKLALCGAAAPRWTQHKDFQYNLPPSAVDELIALCAKDRPQLLANFEKLFSATETSLNEGIRSWLKGIGLSASPYASMQCLMALRDTDLRAELKDIQLPTVILHGKKDKICSFDLAEQMKLGIPHASLVVFEQSGHSLFLEEKDKFNAALIEFARE